MKKHDIPYDQALKMAIQMDAEKDILNVSRINLLLKLKGLDDLNLAHMVSGRSGGSNGGYIGRIPELDAKEKHYAKMEEFREKELKMKEDHYRRMEERQMVFDYHVGKEKNKKNNKKPTALGELRTIYPKWCEGNLTFDPKLPTKKNKQYYRTDILLKWEESNEYEYWLKNHDVHGWDDPSKDEVTKVFSGTHTKLHINIHDGNLPSEKKTH
jgi:hypothetical protein